MSAVLALNCGSSSLKYAVFDGAREVTRGEIERVGDGAVPDHAAAVGQVFDAVAKLALGPLAGVGHRIVHGGPEHLVPARVDAALLKSLESATPFAPLHLPVELRTIAAVTARFGDVPQVVCFDTTFHRTLPVVARRFALPRVLYDSGVRRYGFHGLSYEFVVESLGATALRRGVIAHLGSGASMCAVRDGASVDTTMALTPTAGLVMGTRSGDLDPGLLLYLLDHAGYDARELEHLVNNEAGLLALSETTADMKKLLAACATDPRAALAVDVFCYQAAKWIGAFAAVLGGLDALVFTGGMGQRAPEIRARICRTLGHLGVDLDDARNAAGAAVVSRDGRPCVVRVVATDEEQMVVRHTQRTLGLAG